MSLMFMCVSVILEYFVHDVCECYIKVTKEHSQFEYFLRNCCSDEDHCSMVFLFILPFFLLDSLKNHYKVFVIQYACEYVIPLAYILDVQKYTKAKSV